MFYKDKLRPRVGDRKKGKRNLKAEKLWEPVQMSRPEQK